MPKVLASGVDISEFNGDVDVAGLAGKVDFIIIRCGFGGDYPAQDDPQFANNVRKCKAAGIPYGVYLYSYAKTEAAALSETAHTLRLLRSTAPHKGLLYGVWYDVEDSSLPAGAALVDHCRAYCEALRKAGYYSGVYASLQWWRTRLNSPRLDSFGKWVAQWNSTLNYTGSADLWQYSGSGTIDGKRFDLDHALRDLPRLTRELEGTDMTREEVAALAREEAQRVWDQNEKKYATMENVPGWAREEVEKVYRQLDLAGAGKTGSVRLNASPTYIRALYVIGRLLEEMDAENGSPEEP